MSINTLQTSATCNGAGHTSLPWRAVAPLLSVPPAWLSAEADAGRLPCPCGGRVYLFDVGMVQQLLTKGAPQPVSATEGNRHA
jgi:hypothetical protein